jgi:hypothetical protein
MGFKSRMAGCISSVEVPYMKEWLSNQLDQMTCLCE